MGTRKTAPRPAKKQPSKPAAKATPKPLPKKGGPKKPAPKKASSSSSSKPLYQRLGIKAQDFHIVDAPIGFEIDVPASIGLGFSLPARLGANDAVLVFVLDQQAIKALAKALKKALSTTEETLLWVAYPKGTGAVASDVHRDQGWAPLHELGYQGVSLVAVDDDWSALRLRHQSRSSRRA